MWRVCRRATQTYPPLLFQWSIKSKTHTHVQRTHTHTRSNTKPRHRLKSQSKLAPKGIPTTLFTKGIVYVFRVLSICCRNLRSLSLSFPCSHTHTHIHTHTHVHKHTRSCSVFSLNVFPIRPLIKFKIVHIYLLNHVAPTAHQTSLKRDTITGRQGDWAGGGGTERQVAFCKKRKWWEERKNYKELLSDHKQRGLSRLLFILPYDIVMPMYERQKH